MNLEYCKTLKELIAKNRSIEEPFRTEVDGKSVLPLPATNSDRLRLLRHITSLQCFESMKYNFGRDYGFSKGAIKQEIKDIRRFIKKAQILNPKKAFEKTIERKDLELSEFQRLDQGYYEMDSHRYLDFDYKFGSSLCDVYTKVNVWLPFLKKLVEDESPSEDTEVRILFLKDIWIGSREQYDNLISFLKKNNHVIDRPFVIEDDGKLFWTKEPQKGAIQYLAGLVQRCVIEKLVPDKGLSSDKLQKVLQRTFNIKINSKPLKSIKSRSFKYPKYTEAFEPYFEKTRAQMR